MAGEELEEAVRSNAAQQDTVMEFFMARPGQFFATFQVREILLPDAPHTSVQRCMTNLTDIGILEKTIRMIVGPYKKQVHTWCLKRPEPTIPKEFLKLFTR